MSGPKHDAIHHESGALGLPCDVCEELREVGIDLDPDGDYLRADPGPAALNGCPTCDGRAARDGGALCPTCDE